MEYHFYMKNPNPVEAMKSLAGLVVDIEKTFDGLKYCKCEGLNDKGKRKNVYVEKYGDSDKLRVWQGDTVVREATVITFTFWFVGDNRKNTYEDFYKYVSNGKISYWDDARKKEALLVLIEALEPSEDQFVGSTPYIKADFKFQNLRGECIDNEQGLK